MIVKTALVTGSSSGIGLAIASQLAASGTQVMLHGIEADETGLAIAAQLTEQYGVKTDYTQADLSDPDQIRLLIEKSIARFGHIDILVNNAGIQFTARTEDFPAKRWDQIVAINLSAAFHTTQLVLPVMQKAGWGRIINIASVHGLIASPNKSAYCAAKHGLVGFSKVVALENADTGVTVNCICPGWTDTPLLNDQFQAFADKHRITLEQAKTQMITERQPYPEMVQPSAIGALVLFLCSDAAVAMTGTALPIDGAWTAQ